MRSPDRGFTLIEILVVITIIAALAGMAMALLPVATNARYKAECGQNLQQIGGLLVARRAGDGLQYRNGAAFVVQVAGQVKDDDLKVFTCPGETENPDDLRPRKNSAEFIKLFRDDLDIARGLVEDRHCSYAGPNWRDFPHSHKSVKTRLWACDKCRNGQPHHDGIMVLYDSSKVALIEMRDLTGHTEDKERIVVGKDSPDKRLRQMCFFPGQ